MAGSQRETMVSCVLRPGDPSKVALAIRQFLGQDHPARELIVLDDGGRPFGDLVPRDERVRYLRLEGKPAAGVSLNYACSQARGGIVAPWGEGAWHAPDHLRCAANALLGAEADLVFLAPTLSFDPPSDRAWKLMGVPPGAAPAVFYRSFWREHPVEAGFADLARFAPPERVVTLRNRGYRILLGPPGDLTRAALYPAARVRALFRIAARRTEGRPVPADQRAGAREPLVSCVLLARGRRRLVGIAVSLFYRQDYENSELIVLDDGAESVEDLIRVGARVRYVRLPEGRSAGARRNLGAEQARGEYIACWDADAWYSKGRIRAAVEALEREGADLCGLSRIVCYDPIKGSARLLAAPGGTPWVHRSSLVFRRVLWETHRFPEVETGAEDRFVAGAPSARLVELPDPEQVVSIGPEGMSAGADLRAYPPDRLRRAMGDDRHFYENEIAWGAPAPSLAMPRPGIARPAKTPFVPREPVRAPAARATGGGAGPGPMVSCILPTRDRPGFLRIAADLFLRQDYPRRELIVLDDGERSAGECLPTDGRIRHVRLKSGTSIGAKRNIGCEQAAGEIIAHWDDDDWHAPDRLSRQVRVLLDERADLCGQDPLPVLAVGNGRAWSYRCPIHTGYWAAGGSLLYRKKVWEGNRFPDVDLAEDRQFLWNMPRARKGLVPAPPVLVAMVHGKNVALRAPGSTSSWSRTDAGELLLRLRADWHRYRDAVDARSGAAPEARPIPAGAAGSRPLVSCIMPTYDRRRFVPLAIRYFLRQDYEEKELVVVDDGTDPVEDLMPPDPRVRYIRVPKRISVGAKRNLACELANGEIVLHWDDDDWHAPHRIRASVGALLAEDAELCGLNPVYFYDLRSGLGWLYRYPPEDRFWVAGTSLCYRKRYWVRNRFPDLFVGEDNRFVWGDEMARKARIPDASLCVAILHDRNGSQKTTSSAYWHAHPAGEIAGLLGDDLAAYRDAPEQKRINLGCGEHHERGMWNVDVAPPADEIADLRKPWPWADSSVDALLARDVIEHLPDTIHTMNEAWRVLAPGGRFEISVPTTDGPGAFQDPTHVSYWHRRSFLYFEAGDPHRERFAARYGIAANFRTVSEKTVETESGPYLTIVLEAVKG